MKNLNLNRMENLDGGICLLPGFGHAATCLPCPALLMELNALHSTGEPIFCPL